MQFGWVDFSEKDKNKVLDVLNLLKEPRTVDVLGLSGIREYFSELFFPGIVTNQTRAKYFLIVPYAVMDAGEYGDKNAVDNLEGMKKKLDDSEKKCCKKMVSYAKENKDKYKDLLKGVKGANSEVWISRTPSSIYWSGIKKLKIFNEDVSIKSYLYHCEKRNQYSAAEDDFVLKKEFWDTDIVNLYNEEWKQWKNDVKCSVELTKKEAEYLQDRINMVASGSLLSYLLEATKNSGFGKTGSVAKISDENIVGIEMVIQDRDEHKNILGLIKMYGYLANGEKEPELANNLKMAIQFSVLSYLCIIRYNCLLRGFTSENSGGSNEDQAIKLWKNYYEDKINRMNLLGFDIDEFIGSMPDDKYGKAKSFIKKAKEYLDKDNIEEFDELIRGRETEVKKQFAKLKQGYKGDPKADWVGGNFADYRYGNAIQIVEDIVNGLRKRDIE